MDASQHRVAEPVLRRVRGWRPRHDGALLRRRRIVRRPGVPQLSADQVRAMWRMFCTSRYDIEVHLRTADADDTRGSARWGAIYAVPRTGRQVRNEVEASVAFRDGLIVEHRDDFDLWRWSRMALGPVGAVLGWTPMVQRQIRRQAAAQLRRFQAAEDANRQ